MVELDHRHYLVVASCQGRIPYLVEPSLGCEGSAELASSLVLGYEAYLDLVGSEVLASSLASVASLIDCAGHPDR